MKNTTESSRDRLPCGMVSLRMFKINHSKALIIAYLNMRGGLRSYTFNQTDISNQTNVGKTVVRQYLKELVAEGVLNRKGKSFYKLDRQKMEELYYSADVSESDMHVSENDTDVSESDSEVSESDAIHSSNLNSRKLESSNLDTSKRKASELPSAVKEFLNLSPKEQVAWLDRIEANKTLEKDLRSGKDVPMTAKFVEDFANW
jgi:hypothetical protein